MEYRKSYNTPRERIDDDLLLRILDENEPVSCTYGNSCRRMSRVGNDSSYGNSRISARQENSSASNDCGCEENCARQNSLSGYALAMAYVPDQEWRELYCEEDAMNHGTLFSELYKPFFYGCSGNCR